jgi:phospholipid/cholesterol/gamma-HCH transport system ATP-binding protein
MPLSPSSSPTTSEPRPAPVIRLSGVATQIGDRVLHRDINLEVAAGEVLGIVGASGSGKSVMLRTIIGLVPPAAGRIEVLGDDILQMDEAERHRIAARWGVLFQDGALFSSLTVAENIQVPLKEQLDLPHHLLSDICCVKLALVGLGTDAASKFPAELSGGMRKRAGLARALALDPQLLFLDEPTAGLDPIAAAEFDEMVRDLQQGLGLTVVMVTHDLDSLVAVCDRIAVLVDNGMKIGTIDTLIDDPHPWIRSYFRGPRGRAALTGRHHGAGEA